MKTTVKLDNSRSLVIEPAKERGAVALTLRLGVISVGSMELSADQLGAAIFGLEMAADAAGLAHLRTTGAAPGVML